jgi:hypothetical protein
MPKVAPPRPANVAPPPSAAVIPFRLTERIRRKREEAAARYLYRITGGFVHPDPPSPEAIEMFMDGWEL